METPEIIQFASGRAYSCRSACDHNCVWFFEIIRRTASRITVREIDGKNERTVGITIYDGRETALPMGRFSMAPIIRA